jgi:sugar phosphate isomerase/epimerase
MELGIFAKTFPRSTLDATLDAIVAHGLRNVQFNMSCVGLPTLPERLEEDFCSDIARSLRERGLTMAAISGTFNMCDPHESLLEDNLRRLEVLAAACRWLDTRVITLCTGTRDRKDMWRWHPDNGCRSSWERMAQSMREAVRIADRHEVTLAFEPEVNNVVNSVSKARKLLDEIGSPWLKVVIDPVNLPPPVKPRRLPDFFIEAFEWLGGDIALAHAKALPGDFKFDELLGSEYTTWLMGLLAKSPHPRLSEMLELIEEGKPEMVEIVRWQVFFVPYFRGLKKVSYDGPVILHGTPEADVEKALSCLMPLIQYSKELPD